MDLICPAWLTFVSVCVCHSAIQKPTRMHCAMQVIYYIIITSKAHNNKDGLVIELFILLVYNTTSNLSFHKKENILNYVIQ